MYRLVIADDEEIVRRGLEDLIDWSEMGFELVATFEDGDELIDYLKNNSVDVVFTDIKMMNVSGLDVAKFIYENMPSTIVVIISGYKEFEYAKKAIDYNVEHYILKPTQFEEITRIFTDIKAKLDKKREDEKTILEFRQRYSELIPIMQEQFFVDLLMGALRDEKEIKKRMNLLDLNFDLYTDPCFIIDVCSESYNKYLSEHWEYGRERLNIAFKDIIDGSEEKDGIQYFAIFNRNEPKLIAIAKDGNEIDVTVSIINKHLNRIMESINDILGYKIGLRIESCFNNIFALISQKKPFIIKKDKQMDDENIALTPKEHERLIDKYKLFMSNINDGDLTAVMSLVDTFIDEVQALPLNYIHRLIIDLFSALTNKFMEFNTDLWEITTKRVDYHHIVYIDNVEELRHWLKKVFNDIINSFESYKKISSEHLIQKAKQYIDNNYYKDISLDDVADQIFLNPIYFSRFFKQQTGENFIDYLTKVRMEKAIELLKQNRYKAYEIGEKVGYKNSRYFSRVFKQYTGCTTKEYVRLMLKNGGETT